VYSIGTLGTVLQLLKLPDGTVKVLVEGQQRARIVRFGDSEPEFLSGLCRAGARTMRAMPHEVEALHARRLLRSLSNM
jgi:ATP-dependent Lon protease